MAADFPPVCHPTKRWFLRPKATEQGAFGCVVVDLQGAAIKVGAQAFHTAQGMADCGSPWAFARYLIGLGV